MFVYTEAPRFVFATRDTMHSTRALLAVTAVIACLLRSADGFVVPLNKILLGPRHHGSSETTRTHDDHHHHHRHNGYASTTATATTLLRLRPHSRSTTSNHVLMATGDKKRRRRKGTPATSPAEDSAKAAPAAAAAAASTPSKASAKKDGGASPEGTSGDGPVGEGGVTAVFGEVLQGEKSLEALFSDDWSGMQANTGMVKSKVKLPDISEFVPKKRLEAETLEQRQKKTAVGLTVGKGSPEKELPSSKLTLDSKLSPLVDREEEAYQKRVAERFEEGPVVKALKTATWFAICALVVWEVYINSPFFSTPPPPPI